MTEPQVEPSGVLRLTCEKCTRTAVFSAPSHETATKLAARKGWGHYGGKVICPKCPAYRG